MSEYDDKAAKYRKEAAAEQSPTPTPAELAALKAQKAEEDASAGSKKAYNKASPLGASIPRVPEKKLASGGSIRGGGCESRGKTKGRMV